MEKAAASGPTIDAGAVPYGDREGNDERGAALPRALEPTLGADRCVHVPLELSAARFLRASARSGSQKKRATRDENPGKTPSASIVSSRLSWTVSERDR